jgi:hypothetical protein
MRHVVVRFIDVILVTPNDRKSYLQVKINSPGIADPRIQPHTQLVIPSRKFDSLISIHKTL